MGFWKDIFGKREEMARKDESKDLLGNGEEGNDLVIPAHDLSSFLKMVTILAFFRLGGIYHTIPYQNAIYRGNITTLLLLDILYIYIHFKGLYTAITV